MTNANVINPDPKMIFNKKINIALYLFESSSNGVIEHGIDSYGMIYFHKSNGNTLRYTRREFSKIALEDIKVTHDALKVHCNECVKIDNLFYFRYHN